MGAAIREISTPLARIVKVYLEALTGFRHMYYQEGLSTLVSGGFVLEDGSKLREWWQYVHSKD